MKTALAVCVLALACVTGCVTKQGRVSVIDLDFRKNAEQIRAGARQAEAPYRNWDSITQPQVQDESMKAEALPLAWWEQLFNMISKLECRLTLLQIEWANPGQAVPK